ncbi:hypothetical protein FQN60_017175 [Etheostoma spectabile]|uniref:G-protein coupled receptors family 1 profile domain-containing protein n=1 Tax=Etheostoma spectabile TaxID=54343 RepID=A0A5J5DEQ5_9PERO|nr:hypothetical protein FQN60_017175 [Etheostoma spectabile]
MQECHTGLCLSVYIITFVLGFPANVLAFYTFCKKVRQKPTPIDILLLNLTISDLLFLLFLPFKMQEDSPNTTSSHNVTASSAVGDEKTEVCYANFTKAQLKVLLPVRLELCVVLFCIPFLISSFCYINFIRILSKLQHIDRRRRLRAIGMALGTLLVFALCFGPYNMSHIVGFITWKSPDWRDKALLCSTFNACLDPLIFYFSSSAVRKTVGSVMEGVKSRLNSEGRSQSSGHGRVVLHPTSEGPGEGELAGVVSPSETEESPLTSLWVRGNLEDVDLTVIPPRILQCYLSDHQGRKVLTLFRSCKYEFLEWPNELQYNESRSASSGEEKTCDARHTAHAQPLLYIPSCIPASSAPYPACWTGCSPNSILFYPQDVHPGDMLPPCLHPLQFSSLTPEVRGGEREEEGVGGLSRTFRDNSRWRSIFTPSEEEQ